jgi:hypothetical protein
MARFQWEKARRRDRQRTARLRETSKKAKARQRQADSLRQLAIQAFVDKHSIECFSCGTTTARWAKNGINKRGPWVICVACVARNRSKKRQTEERAHELEKRDLIAENNELHSRQKAARNRRRKGLPETAR